MKVVLYMAMTLNGYIAKETDETPWSKVVWNSYYKIAKKFNALIIGRRTYELMKEANEFEKIGNPFTVVLTKQRMQGNRNTEFAASPQDAINVLKKKGFTKVMLGGGGKVNGAFISEGLIDEIYLDVEPIIFGKGVRLFADADFEKKLTLLSVKKLSSNIIQLHYSVKVGTTFK